MLIRTTSARPSTSGAGRMAPTPTHATATTAQVRDSGRYTPRSRGQACRLAATSIVVPSTTAAPADRTQARGGGGAAVLGMVDQADHRGAHRGDSGRER